ncbi:GvpL/GvpF family gas vesicle protein [bacterium]|nr:GvpL/GvpF family gas vesicle protein [bacterium]
MDDPSAEHTVARETEALYVYCIVPGVQEVDLGPVGLEESEVCSVPGAGICALVHQCPAQPYQSKDRALVEGWVGAHHRVVEVAWKRFGSVLPMSFDMIVVGHDSGSACEHLTKWMLEKEDVFARQLQRLAGKAEYGVRISWDPKVIAADVLQSTPELRETERAIQAKPAGLAYIERTRLENAIKGQMEGRAEEYVRAFYGRISGCVVDTRVGRLRKTDDGTQMLLNVSCLVEKGEHGRLGGLLDEIAEMTGMSVHFTGPWPPYSFAAAG